NLSFWWHASGWAAKSSRFMLEHFHLGGTPPQKGWDGKGAPDQPLPKPRPQETQEERKAKDVREDLFPKDGTGGAGEQVIFIPVAYDANNAPVPGVQYDWEGEDVASGQIIDIPHKGKFASSKQGNYKIKIKMAAHEASAKVKVQGVRHAPGEKPVSPA